MQSVSIIRPTMPRGHHELRQCPKCGSFGSEGDAYCACCGTQLKLTCGSCGTPVEQAVAFYCTHCGTRLAEAKKTEERGSMANDIRHHHGR